MTPTMNFAKNGWKYDNKVTAMMVEDMIFDPILGAKVLLGIRVPPHEELRILWMWCTHFTMDDSGFSTGKSYTHAIVMALRSILMAPRISGVLSGTFRQGKLIFQNFDRWYHNSKIFRSCIKHQRGLPRLIHGSDLWQAFFRGGSEVRVLPPNLLQDANRLRSERWNDGYIDEWTKFGNFESLTSTIIGRITSVNPLSWCPVRRNHVHLTSTPGYMHDPAYPLVSRIDRNIATGSQDYGRFTVNYRHVPKTKEWEGFVDRRVIYSMQTMNPPGLVKSEIDGLWQSDSQSYYSSLFVDMCRHDITPLFSRMMERDIYVCGFDTARGHSDNKRAEGDDFSLTITRIPNGTEQPYPCLVVRKNNISAANMAGIIHQYHQKFQFSLVVYDPGGGGMFVRDELMKTEQVINGTKKPVHPILEFGDTSGVLGDQILIPFRRSSFHFKQAWGTMGSDSVMVNRMHQNIRYAIESMNVKLPNKWSGWNELKVRSDLDAMRLYLRKQSGMTEMNRAKAEMDLMVLQLISVDVTRDDNNDPRVDSYGMYRFASKYKKDSAYSFCYSYTAYLLFKHMIRLGMADGQSSGNSFAVYVGDI